MAAWKRRLQLAGAMVLVGAAVWTALTLRALPAPQTGQTGQAGTSAAPTTMELEPVNYQRDSGLVIPVVGVRAEQLIDTFTQARENGARVHDAIDIMAPRGTPVLAAAPGTIEKLFLSKGGGLTIYQRSNDRRRIYYYAHLDAYAPGLRQGQMVHPGAVIGAVGFSGNADPRAPHLHFAVFEMPLNAKWYQQGVAINPYPLLTGH